jgi:hypothetical protein
MAATKNRTGRRRRHRRRNTQRRRRTYRGGRPINRNTPLIDRDMRDSQDIEPVTIVFPENVSDSDAIRYLNKEFSQIFNTYDVHTGRVTPGTVWDDQGTLLGVRTVPLYIHKY